MHRPFRQLLGPRDRDAVGLINDERIIRPLSSMEHYFRTLSSSLEPHVCGTMLIVWVDADPIGNPADKTVPRRRLVIGFLIPVEALLAQRHPDTPEKRFINSMDGNFQHGTNESIRIFAMRDGAEIVRQRTHGSFLL